MLDYTIDVLLIGLIAAILVEAIKVPIKTAFSKNGLTESNKQKKVFNAIMLAVVLVVCFAGSCIYFQYFKHINPFTSLDIVYYIVGTVGASQTIYKLLETYGRDGVWEIIKSIMANRHNQTNLTTIQKLSTDELAQKISDGIGQVYEDAPITQEDIKLILDHIQ